MSFHTTSRDSKTLNKSSTAISLKDLDFCENLSSLNRNILVGGVCTESEQLFADLRAAFEAGDVIAIAEANAALFVCFFGEEGSFTISPLDTAVTEPTGINPNI